MKMIPLRGKNGEGKFALVDDDEYEKLSSVKWYCDKDGYARRSFYLRGIGRIGYEMMHRVVAGTPKGMITDHINGNRLDNRRENLRVVTMTQSNAHRTGRKRKSIYKGVHKTVGCKTYHVCIQHNGSRHEIHGFTDIEEAAIEYDKLALRLHGEYAVLNFPQRELEALEDLTDSED